MHCLRICSSRPNKTKRGQVNEQTFQKNLNTSKNQQSKKDKALTRKQFILVDQPQLYFDRSYPKKSSSPLRIRQFKPYEDLNIQCTNDKLSFSNSNDPNNIISFSGAGNNGHHSDPQAGALMSYQFIGNKSLSSRMNQNKKSIIKNEILKAKLQQFCQLAFQNELQNSGNTSVKSNKSTNLVNQVPLSPQGAQYEGIQERPVLKDPSIPLRNMPDEYEPKNFEEFRGRRVVMTQSTLLSIDDSHPVSTGNENYVVLTTNNNNQSSIEHLKSQNESIRLDSNVHQVFTIKPAPQNAQQKQKEVFISDLSSNSNQTQDRTENFFSSSVRRPKQQSSDTFINQSFKKIHQKNSSTDHSRVKLDTNKLRKNFHNYLNSYHHSMTHSQSKNKLNNQGSHDKQKVLFKINEMSSQDYYYDSPTLRKSEVYRNYFWNNTTYQKQLEGQVADYKAKKAGDKQGAKDASEEQLSGTMVVNANLKNGGASDIHKIMSNNKSSRTPSRAQKQRQVQSQINPPGSRSQSRKRNILELLIDENYKKSTNIYVDQYQQLKQNAHQKALSNNNQDNGKAISLTSKASQIFQQQSASQTQGQDPRGNNFTIRLQNMASSKEIIKPQQQLQQQS
ncbi:UNKNOWN [Stylonychia lemnae]|uniref:Uncharacterized protein n=1 Tax=Stylonychia lemnae TaxID=5949 RepID=A0A078B2P7_STYLE|nr:UNKNOWN [Stylonychia lemnae]|eukprot:CDW88511.1 UNKNOWN [Stylonychia lemnae]